MSSKSSDTRKQILTAAQAILIEGKEILTLDAVMRRTGISKGGLIHHFPNKDILIEGIVGAFIEHLTPTTGIEPDLDSLVNSEEISTYIDANLDPSVRKATADLSRGLIRLYGASIGENNTFLDPWRRMFAQRLDHLKQANDLTSFAKVAIVALVIESFLMIDVFNLYQFSESEMAEIKKELIKTIGS